MGRRRLGKKRRIPARHRPPIYERERLKSLGVSDDEIPLFVDPQKYVDYCASQVTKSLESFGISVNSFLTTTNDHFRDEQKRKLQRVLARTVPQKCTVHTPSRSRVYVRSTRCREYFVYV